MHTVLPILLAMAAIFCGSLVDAAIKGAAVEISVISLVASRYVVGGVILGGVLAYTDRRWPSGEQVRFHALRGALQTFAALTFFSSITILALAEATILALLAVLMVPWFAKWLLGETIRPLTYFAAVLGLIGAVMAVGQPPGGAPPDTNRALGVACALAAAVTYALIVVLMRLRSNMESSVVQVAFLNVSCGINLLPIAVWAFTAAPPTFAATTADLPIIVGLAIAGIFVWWLLTAAYARAPAQRISYFDYTSIIWAALLGMAFFGEIPKATFWAGALIILIGCALVAFDTHLAQQSAKQTAQ